MYTDERIHAYCRRNPSIQSNDSIRKLVQIPNSSQIVLNDHPDANMQNQLNEEIKYNSINLFTLYWDSMFDLNQTLAAVKVDQPCMQMKPFLLLPTSGFW